MFFQETSLKGWMRSEKTIVIIVGTRPEIIKMAPVYHAVAATPGLRTIILSTGQQREMASQALKSCGLQADVDLGVMMPNQTLPELTSRLIPAVAESLACIKPDVVLVHGDTTTAFAAAVAAFYSRIPVGHVEAGLRTYDFQAPWPEEMNRRLIDPLCRWCFAPTTQSRDNLLGEKIEPANIYVTGNTVIDALLQIHARLRADGHRAADVALRCGVSQRFVERYLGDRGKMVLVTGHRRESFGGAFRNLCQGIKEVVLGDPNVGIIYPVHLNPNVQAPVRELLGNDPRIQLIQPVAYEDFVVLMGAARFILTDSGGIQEEAPSLGKPVLVMRDTTERPEGVLAGTSRLVGTDPRKIADESLLLLRDETEYQKRCDLKNPYGDGKAADRIAQILSETIL
jgi:UDP-N-acetylglucosamine 2-epimerase (non-hydrolysing)